MTNDLVNRLRGQRTNGVLCDEAADEIERLRAEPDWKKVAEALYEEVQSENWTPATVLFREAFELGDKQ